MVFFVFCLLNDQMSGGRRPCFVEELSSEADIFQLGQFFGDEKVFFPFYQCTSRLQQFPMWQYQAGQGRARGGGAASLHQDLVRGPPSEGVACLEQDQDPPWDEPQGDDYPPLIL